MGAVKALYIADRDEFCRRLEPGSFWISDLVDDDERSFWYCCPCGCGRRAPLTVGENFKPADGSSWNWNGSREAPTLRPSVHHVGHWHGWLTDGEWRAC